jgi:hypothetical protein
LLNAAYYFITPACASDSATKFLGGPKHLIPLLFSPGSSEEQIRIVFLLLLFILILYNI